MKLIAALVLFVTAAAGALVRAPAASATEVDDVSHSVAVVETSTGRGTGFLVGDRLLITAAHVATSKSVTLVFGKTTIAGHVTAKNTSVDLALIELDGDPGTKPLTIAEAAPELGEDVFAIGAPTSGGLTVTRGIVSAVFDSGEIQTDASVNPGNSGGPLVRPDGSVLGLVTMKAQAEGIGYAVGADEMRRIIANPSKAGSSGSDSDAGSGSLVPGSQQIEPLESNSSSVLMVIGVAGIVFIVACAGLGLRFYLTRSKKDFEVRLGPYNDRFGG